MSKGKKQASDIAQMLAVAKKSNLSIQKSVFIYFFLTSIKKDVQASSASRMWRRMETVDFPIYTLGCLTFCKIQNFGFFFCLFNNEKKKNPLFLVHVFTYDTYLCEGSKVSDIYLNQQ